MFQLEMGLTPAIRCHSEGAKRLKNLGCGNLLLMQEGLSLDKPK